MTDDEVIKEEPHYCEDCHQCHVGECYGYGVEDDEQPE